MTFIQYVAILLLATLWVAILGYNKYIIGICYYLFYWILLILLHLILFAIAVLSPVFGIMKYLHIFDFDKFVRKFQK